MSKDIKELILFDKNESRDNCNVHKTLIEIKNLDTGELIFRGSNKVILAGSTFTAKKHFDITVPVMTPTYNEVLELENSVLGEVHEEDLEKVILYAIGIDGCGVGPAQLNEVDYSKWLAPEDMISFRYPLLTEDLDAANRELYFGRKVNGDRVHYYFKRFETAPVWRQQYIDGTPIDANVYASTKTDPIESFVELKLRILKEDARDFFKYSVGAGGIENAQVSTIMLLTAWRKTYGAYGYYQDIRPLTKLNFPIEYLIDPTKALDITYHIYY